MYALEVSQQEGIMIQPWRKGIWVECPTQQEIPFTYTTKTLEGILEEKLKKAKRKVL